MENASRAQVLAAAGVVFAALLPRSVSAQQNDPSGRQAYVAELERVIDTASSQLHDIIKATFQGHPTDFKAIEDAEKGMGREQLLIHRANTISALKVSLPS